MTRHNVLDLLIKLFYQGSLNFTLEQDSFEKFDWNMQNEFLKATLLSNLVKKFPVKGHFLKLFLKKLITYLEPYQEIHDELYTCLCTAMNSRLDNEYYKHYVIDNSISNIITIKETSNMVIDGTTGMRTWEASLILCDWALSNKEVFENKSILELGSGVGFAGITIAKHCNPQSVIMTDNHDGVLKTITENIAINFSEEINNTKTATMNLDWTNIAGVSNETKPDIIIGADIIYDPSILKPLCSTLQLFFEKNKKLDVYISSIIRNETTYKQFLFTLDAANLTYEEINFNSSVHLHWDTDISKSFIKIKDYS